MVLIDARGSQATHIVPVIPIATPGQVRPTAPSLSDYDHLLNAAAHDQEHALRNGNVRVNNGT